MFNVIVKRSLKGATLTSLIIAGIASCSSDDTTQVIAGPATSTTSGQGGAPATSTTSNGGNGGSSTMTTSSGSSGASGSTGSTGGSAGSGGSTGSSGSGGGGGSAGSGGAGGTGGAGGAKDGGMVDSGKEGGSDASTPGEGGAMCTPMGGMPNATTGWARTGWGGQWTPACNFKSGNGQCSDLPPKNAFDGKSNRTSLGDTHLMEGKNTAEQIGDTFTFDMQTCHSVSKVEFYCGDPPNNGGFDARDFPGQVEVSVSSDCTTNAGTGEITGTFTPFTPALLGNEPLVNGQGCSKSSCPGPFTITFPTGTAARCVRMRLTKILAAGGGVWWAIDELYVF